MKSLSLSRPLILMTVGLPGAGKTRFSVRFAEMFLAPLVSIDRIQAELFAEPTYSNEEVAAVQRLADYQIQELLKTKKTIIIDGAANAKADRTVLRKLASKHGYSTLLVWVQTDPLTCEARSVNSRVQQDEPRHQPLSQAAFGQLSRRFQPPAVHEPYVVISGKHTYGAQARTVLKRLVASDAHQQPIAPAHQVTTLSPRPPRSDQPPSPPTRRNVTIH